MGQELIQGLPGRNQERRRRPNQAGAGAGGGACDYAGSRGGDQGVYLWGPTGIALAGGCPPPALVAGPFSSRPDSSGSSLEPAWTGRLHENRKQQWGPPGSLDQVKAESSRSPRSQGSCRGTQSTEQVESQSLRGFLVMRQEPEGTDEAHTPGVDTVQVGQQLGQEVGHGECPGRNRKGQSWEEGLGPRGWGRSPMANKRTDKRQASQCPAAEGPSTSK